MGATFLVSLTEQELKQFLKEALRELLAEGLSKPTAEEPINIALAAEFLDLEVTTLYEKTSKRLIPHFKKGNKLYFYRSELLDWVTKGRRKTSDETKTEAATFLLKKKK